MHATFSQRAKIKRIKHKTDIARCYHQCHPILPTARRESWLQSKAANHIRCKHHCHSPPALFDGMVFRNTEITHCYHRCRPPLEIAAHHITPHRITSHNITPYEICICHTRPDQLSCGIISCHITSRCITLDRFISGRFMTIHLITYESITIMIMSCGSERHLNRGAKIKKDNMQNGTCRMLSLLPLPAFRLHVASTVWK